MVEIALLGAIVGTLKFKSIPFLAMEREREREIFLPNDLPLFYRETICRSK